MDQNEWHVRRDGNAIDFNRQERQNVEFVSQSDVQLWVNEEANRSSRRPDTDYVTGFSDG